jgi:hypothetical protein
VHFVSAVSIAFHRHRSPWLAGSEPVRLVRALARVRDLDASVIVSAHGPLITGTRIAHALEVVADLVVSR